ncbi:MAG: phosphoribosylanthranilate isomerase [Dehalococcoidia bacterium]
MPKVKICGLRDAASALAAADAGADFLGVVFVEGVRRQVQPSDARAFVDQYRDGRQHTDAPPPKLVGLFRNQPADWVNQVVTEIGLDYVQLCGEEDEAYISQLSTPVFRQVRVKEDASPAGLTGEVAPHLASGRIVVLDRYDAKLPGGGGEVFDWSAAVGIAAEEHVLLAGGLTPENVRSAIDRLHPWGVDVSSGVEVNGTKDPSRIRAFVQAARGGKLPVR